MGSLVKTAVALGTIALVAIASAQRKPQPITHMTRPITRAQVEALFARAPGSGRGHAVFSAVLHAPHDVAVVVWPAKDADLIKLLPRYKGWVVYDAVLRATPGVVPTLEKAIRMGIGPSGGSMAAFGPYASPGGEVVNTLGKIPGPESSRVLHDLVASTNPQIRIGALHGLSVRKRAFAHRRQEVKDAIGREIARDFRSASALGPGYLMLASPTESRKLMRRVYDQAVRAEAAPHRRRQSPYRERFVQHELRALRVSASLWLVSVGDRALLPRVRAVLKGDKEGFLAVDALQVLAERVGSSERLTLESALTAPSSRTRKAAAIYLGQLGDRRSIAALRAASKIPAPDEASGWGDGPRKTMLAIADMIESGKRRAFKFESGTPVPWWRL